MDYKNDANLWKLLCDNSNEQIESLMVYDMVGKQVKITATVNAKLGSINVSNLSKGVYLVEIITANKFRLVKKLVIE